MATLKKAEITNLTVHPLYENQNLRFNVDINNEGKLPKITANDFSSTGLFYNPYGSLQCTHHLSYADNSTVDIEKEYKVSNAAAIVKTNNIVRLTDQVLELDFGLVDEQNNFDAFNFVQKMNDTTNNYRYADSLYMTGFNTRPFNAVQKFMYTYKGNTNDNINWFRTTYDHTTGLTFYPNDGWNSPSIAGWMEVKGLVNGTEEIVGVIKPYIYVNSLNHLKAQYTLVHHNSNFDFDGGEYTVNKLSTMYNATSNQTWWENGNPTFQMVLVPAP